MKLEIWLSSSFFIFFMWISLLVEAQIVSSPYAIIGFGRQMPDGTVRNIAMGGVGVSMGSVSTINVINPALLAYNSFTAFELAGVGEHKVLSSSSQSQRGFGASLGYFGFVFPASPRWKLGIGLRPFSLVNYSASSVVKIQDAPNFVVQTLKGSGGVSQFYLSQSFLIAKGFAIGLNVSYNFGSVNDERKSQLVDTYYRDRYVVGKFEQTNYRDFIFQPGTYFSIPLSQNQYLHVGGVYEFKKKHRIEFFDALQRKDVFNDLIVYSDTLFFDAKGSITFPSSFTVGMSYEKLGKFSIGFDFTKENWSEYVSRSSPKLNDTQRMSLGGEFTPDYRSVSNYFKRITYRLGFKFEQLPINFAGKQLDDYSISTGFSLPMSKGFSSINVAVSYGLLDGKKIEAITEKYIRFHLGLAINDRWFVKRKIN